MIEMIYERAKKELPSNVFRFQDFEFIAYKGLKILKNKFGYFAYDMRPSDYYEPLSSEILQQIYQHGLKNTADMLQYRYDTVRVRNTSRMIKHLWAKIDQERSNRKDDPDLIDKRIRLFEERITYLTTRLFDYNSRIHTINKDL